MSHWILYVLKKHCIHFPRLKLQRKGIKGIPFEVNHINDEKRYFFVTVYEWKLNGLIFLQENTEA